MTLKIYGIYLALLSATAFIFYALDKKRAKLGEWRIKERTLLLLSFFGGAVGGYLAMKLARHKTKKWYFHAVTILGIAWQIYLLCMLIENPNLLF